MWHLIFLKSFSSTSRASTNTIIDSHYSLQVQALLCIQPILINILSSSPSPQRSQTAILGLFSHHILLSSVLHDVFTPSIRTLSSSIISQSSIWSLLRTWLAMCCCCTSACASDWCITWLRLLFALRPFAWLFFKSSRSETSFATTLVPIQTLLDHSLDHLIDILDLSHQSWRAQTCNNLFAVSKHWTKFCHLMFLYWCSTSSVFQLRQSNSTSCIFIPPHMNSSFQ